MMNTKDLYRICSNHPEFNKDVFMQEGRKMRDANIVKDFLSILSDFIDGKLKKGTRNKCNSYIAYWAGMTTAKPIGNFRPNETMAAARVSPPDVDMDFDYFRREEVYNYLISTYGEDYTCNIGTYNSFKVRATLRSVAKAMDLANDWVSGSKTGERTLAMADSIAKMADSKSVSLKEAISGSPELMKIMNSYPRYAKACEKIEGRISCGGVHAAGIVVSNTKVKELSPMRTSSGVVCSQFDKDEVEKIGLLKFDILALKTLSVIDQCVKMIAQRHNVTLDVDSIEPNDQNVFKLFNSGLTNGVFQMEGYGITKLILDMHIDSFEDIVAVNAIYRPGPLGAKVNELYCDFKFGRKTIEYPHPSMKQVLDPTYSMIVYQEQVMNLSKAMAGFTSSEADKLRKAIGKKNMEIMSEMKSKFISGCGSNGITEKIATDTWDKIELFGGYGFNRSHAACYAYLAYQTAYLKRYYTIEYMCSLMSANIGDDEKIEKYMNEVKTVLKIPLYGPDVNKSKDIFIIEGNGIRTPLTFVKGVGDVAVRKIMENQPYEDFRQFTYKNNGVSTKVVSLLCEAGAMRHFGRDKASLSEYFSSLKKEMKSSKVKESSFSNAPTLLSMMM